MQWNEVNRRADVLFAQGFDELASSDAQTLELQLNHVKMPSMLHVGPANRCLDLRQPGELMVVGFSDSPAGLPKTIGLLQLFDANGSRNIRQIVLVTGRDDFIVPRALVGVAFPSVFTDAVEAHYAHAVGPLRIVGCGASPFAGGNRFGRVEGQAGDITSAADHFI